MAITTNDIINIAKNDRSMAVNAKVAMLNAQVTALEQDTYFDRYLHGDTSTRQYIGFNDLIWYHYKEKQYEVGDTISLPPITTLSSYRTSYRNVLTAALVSTGDGLDGFYPPDENGVASQDMNFGNFYLQKNGDTTTIKIGDTTYVTYTTTSPKIGTFLGYIKAVMNATGDSAINKGDSYSGYVYSSSDEARDVARTYVYGAAAPPGTQYNIARTGSGLYGRRTCNDYITTDSSTLWRWRIGQDGVSDQPNFYGDSVGDTNGFLATTAFKTNFLDALKNLGQAGDSMSAYYSHIKNLNTQINWVFGDSNPYLFASKIDIGDTPNLTDVILNALNNIVGDSSDVVGDSTIWGYYNFFKSATGSTANFNFYLNRIVKRGDSLRTVITNRYNSIDGLLGTYGDSEPMYSKERKQRVFWVKQRIGKPTSSLINYGGIGLALNMSTKQLTEKDNSLNTLLGNTLTYHLQFIPTPKMLTVYPDPAYDEDGEITRRKTTSVYLGQQHATYYWIYRQPMPSPSVSAIANTQWSDTYHYDTQSIINDETNAVKNMFTDTGDSFSGYAGGVFGDTIKIGSGYVYRVRVFDTTYKVGGDTTGSLQSDIFDTTTAKSFTTPGDSKVIFGDSHKLSANNFLVINSTASKNGYYLITNKGDTWVTVSPSLTGESSGIAYQTGSAVRISL